MPHVLIVDSDDKSRARTASALISSGHYVMEASLADEAESWVKTLGVDLIIADAHMDGVSSSEVHQRLRALLAPYPVPFIFLVGDQPPADLVTEGGVMVLTNPPDLAELTRSVQLMLGSVYRTEGLFAHDDHGLDELLGRVETTEESGVLTAYRGRTVKKLFFQNGHLSFVCSNDPRDLAVYSLVRAGLVERDALRDALSAKSISPLQTVLESVTPQKAALMKELLTRTTREGLLELYLWDHGKWFYFGGAASPFERMQWPIRVPLDPLRSEGQWRKERWPRFRGELSSDELKFRIHKNRFPTGFPSNAGDRRLLDFIEHGYTLGQMRLELGGQDYLLFGRLTSLLDEGILSLMPITRIGVTAPTTPVSGPTLRDELKGEETSGEVVPILMEKARNAMDEGDYDAAREVFQDVLVLDPVNQEARRELMEAEAQTTSFVRKDGITPEAELCLTVGLEDLDEPSPGEAFVLSRLAAGSMRVEDLLGICPMLEVEVLQIVQRYVKQGAIQLS